jgi:hypothetical protein
MYGKYYIDMNFLKLEKKKLVLNLMENLPLSILYF